jgi:hypothetical protein
LWADLEPFIKAVHLERAATVLAAADAVEAREVETLRQEVHVLRDSEAGAIVFAEVERDNAMAQVETLAAALRSASAVMRAARMATQATHQNTASALAAESHAIDDLLYPRALGAVSPTPQDAPK